MLKTKTCKYCHNPIPIPRLKARPDAETCIPCQDKLENGKMKTTVDNGNCKRCGAPMVSRHSKKTSPTKYFLGCRNYPRCTYTVWAD